MKRTRTGCCLGFSRKHCQRGMHVSTASRRFVPTSSRSGVTTSHATTHMTGMHPGSPVQQISAFPIRKPLRSAIMNWESYPRIASLQARTRSSSSKDKGCRRNPIELLAGSTQLRVVIRTGTVEGATGYGRVYATYLALGPSLICLKMTGYLESSTQEFWHPRCCRSSPTTPSFPMHLQ